MEGIVANNGLMDIGVMTEVTAGDIHHLGGAMLPWEAPVGLAEARRRFGEDEDEEFEQYDFDEDEDEDKDKDKELDEDEDEDFDDLDEDDDDYDEIEENFDDDDGEPRSPRRKKNWE